jgi:DNA-binding transcriptional MerR regulator
MATFSTSEAARKCGVHQITLQHWVSAGKVAARNKTRVGSVIMRL